MSESSQDTGVVSIAEPGVLYYRSELFPVVVRAKQISKGILRDQYLLGVELLEDDPTVTRTALMDVPEDVYKSVGVGERVQARLYFHPSDETWRPTPPLTR